MTKKVRAQKNGDHVVSKSDIQAEVDKNYEAFVAQLPSLLVTRRDTFALMKGGEIFGFYSTVNDARSAASTFLKDQLYSIQEVTDASSTM